MSLILALIGPTAVGKTDVSIELARRLDAEIVGCDSMQVYRRMPILSQQPTPEQRAAVPHHLIDCVEPDELFNAGRYRAMAVGAIREIQARGKSVLFVGGTGLYLKALTHGLCKSPPVDLRLRERLLQEAMSGQQDHLYQELTTVDPQAAAGIHPNDTRRIVRALEVYRIAGAPLSSFWKQPVEALPIPTIALTREREDLYARINRRVEHMLDNEGVLEEARQVGALQLSRTAAQVHGLRYLTRFLDGQADRATTVKDWQQQVRNYARRQLIWFRKYPEIRWVQAGAQESIDAIVNCMRAKGE